METITTKERLKTKKDFLLHELTYMNLYLDSEQQMELMSAISDVLFMQRMKRKKIEQDINYIGSDDYFKQAHTIGSIKLGLIKLITEL